jgi:hypothetical protein
MPSALSAKILVLSFAKDTVCKGHPADRKLKSWQPLFASHTYTALPSSGGSPLACIKPLPVNTNRPSRLNATYVVQPMSPSLGFSSTLTKRPVCVSHSSIPVSSIRSVTTNRSSGLKPGPVRKTRLGNLASPRPVSLYHRENPAIATEPCAMSRQSGCRLPCLPVVQCEGGLVCWNRNQGVVGRVAQNELVAYFGRKVGYALPRSDAPDHRTFP